MKYSKHSKSTLETNLITQKVRRSTTVPPQQLSGPRASRSFSSAAQWLSCRCGGRIKALTVPDPSEVHEVPYLFHVHRKKQMKSSPKIPVRPSNGKLRAVFKMLQAIISSPENLETNSCAGARLVPRLLPSSQQSSAGWGGGVCW